MKNSAHKQEDIVIEWRIGRPDLPYMYGRVP